MLTTSGGTLSPRHSGASSSLSSSGALAARPKDDRLSSCCDNDAINGHLLASVLSEQRKVLGFRGSSLSLCILVFMQCYHTIPQNHVTQRLVLNRGATHSIFKRQIHATETKMARPNPSTRPSSCHSVMTVGTSPWGYLLNWLLSSQAVAIFRIQPSS